jgi:Uncharacterized conserved protein
MKILKIMAILLAVVAVVSIVGCTEKVQVAGNETQKASEKVATAAAQTTSVTKSVPSVTPSVKNNTDSTSSTVVDLVCKMEIDKTTAEFTSEYKGTTYYFCSASCKKKFDENPEKYINSENQENGTQEASEQVTSAATNSTGSTLSTVVDVVCKMEIDKNTTEFTSEYKGTTYYFCALSCKEKFDENPEKYINSEISENNSETTENETQEVSEQVTSAVANDTDSTSSTVVDVVCKMKVDKRTAEFTSEYKGTMYYFCSTSCKEKFGENPEKYINSETAENETQKDCKITENKTQKNCKTTVNKTQKDCKITENKAQNNYKSIENKTRNNHKTAENKTQEASKQVTSVAKKSTSSTSSTVVDVVCKMKIDKTTAEFTSKYKGKMYYFCSASCKEKFDENPGKYT